MGTQARTDLTGRKVIYTDVDTITATNVMDVLQLAILAHEVNRNAIDYLYKYNNGVQPILYRKKEVREEINNKIVVNRANEITSFKVGYLLGEPLQYVSRDSQEDSVTDKVTQLNEFMYCEDKASKDKELADWFTICGTSYRMVLPNKSRNKEESPFNIFTLDPRNTFVVYYNGLGNKPVMGVKYIEQSDGSRIYSVYTKDHYFEIMNGVLVKDERHILDDIPIIEYPANTARLGAFEIVVPLLDAYNLTVSDRLNGLEQFVQSLIKFVNVDISPEDFEKLKALGGIKFKSTSDNPADVEYLTPELNQTNTQTILDDNKAQFLALGYEDTLATETAEAMVQGDMAKVFANQKKHQEAQRTALEAELLSKTPTPPAGDETETLTKEKFAKLGYEDRVKLFNENPTLYNELAKTEN